jgi:hypothetical protein
LKQCTLSPVAASATAAGIFAPRRRHGARHIDRFGLLGPPLTIGHGVWVDRADLVLIDWNWSEF